MKMAYQRWEARVCRQASLAFRSADVYWAKACPSVTKFNRKCALILGP